MKTIQTIEQIRAEVRALRRRGQTIGFVPTMGALHQGHESLLQAASAQCDAVVVSIFVNPSQFGPGEDYDKYPRPFDRDARICRSHEVDILFHPSPEIMYAQDHLTWITVEKLTNGLCGAHRPGHFRGVATVCAKLFHIVLPDVAFFGQKDAQQVAVIQRMVSDLNMPLSIAVCPTVREADGLAISSRNKYLNEAQRLQATSLYRALQQCRSMVAEGVREVPRLTRAMGEVFSREDLEAEYISVVETQTLQPIDRITDQALVAVAVQVGPARLIDNILVDVNEM